MANFMDGFMKGYAFMENIEDNRNKRERDAYTFERMKKADVRADNVQLAQDLESQINLLYTDKDGNRLTDEQVAKDPNKRSRITELMNMPAFKEVWMEGVPKGVADIRVEELADNPDGTVTPVFTHVDGRGQALSTGPATIDRKGKADDPEGNSIIAKASITEGLNKLKSHVAKYSPTYSKEEVARRKEAGYKRDLGTVMSGVGRQAPSPQSVAQTTTQPSTQREPISTTQSAQPSVSPTKETDTQPAPKPGSITERAQKVKPTTAGAIPAAAEAFTKESEGLGTKLFERGVRSTVTEFERAAEGNDTNLNRIINYPKQSGSKLVEHYGSIERKVGPEKAQELRKVIYDTLKERGTGDPELMRDLERLEVLSPKLMSDVKKVEKAMPEEPKAKKEQLKKDQALLASMKPGAKFSKQTGGPSKSYKDALIRLHMANPKAFPVETLERGLRTGRLSKRDIQTFAGADYLIQVDKESGEILRNDRFASSKDKIAMQKFRSKQYKDEAAAFKDFAKEKYGTDKKAQQSKDTYLKRLSVAKKTWGINVQDFANNYAMLSNAEDIINSQIRGSGFLGFGGDKANDYPSLTPGIIAQSLGKKTLDEANETFFRPIQETKAYGGGIIPEAEARNLANVAVAIQLRSQKVGKPMTMEQVSAFITNHLQGGDRRLAKVDPALFAERLLSE